MLRMPALIPVSAWIVGTRVSGAGWTGVMEAEDGGQAEASACRGKELVVAHDEVPPGAPNAGFRRSTAEGTAPPLDQGTGRGDGASTCCRLAPGRGRWCPPRVSRTGLVVLLPAPTSTCRRLRWGRPRAEVGQGRRAWSTAPSHWGWTGHRAPSASRPSRLAPGVGRCRHAPSALHAHAGAGRGLHVLAPGTVGPPRPLRRGHAPGANGAATFSTPRPLHRGRLWR